jgi:hypothetical protein
MKRKLSELREARALIAFRSQHSVTQLVDAFAGPISVESSDVNNAEVTLHVFSCEQCAGMHGSHGMRQLGQELPGLWQHAPHVA